MKRLFLVMALGLMSLGLTAECKAGGRFGGFFRQSRENAAFRQGFRAGQRQQFFEDRFVGFHGGGFVRAPFVAVDFRRNVQVRAPFVEVGRQAFVVRRNVGGCH